MMRSLSAAVLLLGCAYTGPTVFGEDGPARRDPMEWLRLAFRDGTKVLVRAENGGADNEVRLVRAAPVRVREAKPERVEFVFVVNHAKPGTRPVDGIVPVLEERVVRQLEQRRDEWTERARANARREFGNDVRVEVAATLYNDQQEHHLDRLKHEGFVVKTDPIRVEGEDAAMLLLVREHYAERDRREVTFTATLRFAATLQDHPEPNMLAVVLNARLDGPTTKAVATGSLAQLDPRHLEQVERTVQSNVELILGGLNRPGGRRLPVQRLEDARTKREQLTNRLTYPWFGEHPAIIISYTPPPPLPAGGLGDDDW